MRVFRCKSKRELVHLALGELLRAEKRRETLKTRELEGGPESPIQDPKRQEKFRTALKEVNTRYSSALKKLAE